MNDDLNEDAKFSFFSVKGAELVDILINVLLDVDRHSRQSFENSQESKILFKAPEDRSSKEKDLYIKLKNKLSGLVNFIANNESYMSDFFDNNTELLEIDKLLHDGFFEFLENNEAEYSLFFTHSMRSIVDLMVHSVGVNNENEGNIFSESGIEYISKINKDLLSVLSVNDENGLFERFDRRINSLKDEARFIKYSKSLSDKIKAELLDSEEKIDLFVVNGEEVSKKINKNVNIMQAKLDDFEADLHEKRGELSFTKLSFGFSSLKGELDAKVDKHKRFELYYKIAIPIAPIVFFMISINSIGGNEGFNIENALSYALPFTLSVLLVYFLRLEIKDRQHYEAQVTELENKLALIQFIEHYVDFYSDKSDKSLPVMESFNKMIFAPISNPANGNSVLNVTDSLEPLIALVAKDKKGNS